jgi:putative GTP pyrophosphokinase
MGYTGGMDGTFSKTRIDKLGERLKLTEPSEDDLRMLDAYRRTFGEPYEYVVGIIRKRLKLEPTGRPAKSTSAIREKLRRESIRLSQIQDIAGCRIIVSDIAAQNIAIERIIAAVPESATVVDRRKNPSHGYRAVHIVIRVNGVLIEVQCRTELQHLWSQLSERLADTIDPAIKYGGGPEKTVTFLIDLASLAATLENSEQKEPELVKRVSNLPSAPQDLLDDIETLRKNREKYKKEFLVFLNESIQRISA